MFSLLLVGSCGVEVPWDGKKALLSNGRMETPFVTTAAVGVEKKDVVDARQMHRRNEYITRGLVAVQVFLHNF